VLLLLLLLLRLLRRFIVVVIIMCIRLLSIVIIRLLLVISCILLLFLILFPKHALAMWGSYVAEKTLRLNIPQANSGPGRLRLRLPKKTNKQNKTKNKKTN